MFQRMTNNSLLVFAGAVNLSTYDSLVFSSEGEGTLEEFYFTLTNIEKHLNACYTPEEIGCEWYTYINSSYYNHGSIDTDYYSAIEQYNLELNDSFGHFSIFDDKGNCTLTLICLHMPFGKRTFI
jgi:hypothetical protein